MNEWKFPHCESLLASITVNWYVLLAECLAHTIIAAIQQILCAGHLRASAGGCLMVHSDAAVRRTVRLVPRRLSARRARALRDPHDSQRSRTLLLCDYLRSIYQAELVLENLQNYRLYIPPANRAHNLSRVSTTRMNAVLLIVCSTLELVLEALLVYKLLPALLHLWRGSPAHKENTLHELKCKDGCACVGASASEHDELAALSAWTRAVRSSARARRWPHPLFALTCLHFCSLMTSSPVGSVETCILPISVLLRLYSFSLSLGLVCVFLLSLLLTSGFRDLFGNVSLSLWVLCIYDYMYDY